MDGLERIDAAAGWRWLLAAHARLGALRDDLDALNVFPVPDGDTGTNLYLTLNAALESMLAAGLGHPSTGMVRAATTLALEALLAARGNSGVILSQILRGISEVVAETPDADALGLTGAHLADALTRAAHLARQGVSRPVEGTILSVADAAARGAHEGVAALGAVAGSGAAAVARAARLAAERALAQTPRQLPMLGRAGVVDAGGAGLVVVLAALEEALTGAAVRVGPWAHRPDARQPREAPGGGDDTDGHDAGAHAAPASGSPLIASPPQGGAAPEVDGSYEVMYVVRGLGDEARGELRARLDYLGDSVLVVGDPRATTAHVHTVSPGPAIEAAYEVGRPERIRVTWLGAPPLSGEAPGAARAVVRPPERRPSPSSAHRHRTGVLACAPGPHLAAAMAAAGAWVVLSAPGRRATTGDLLAARRRVPAESVVVLANHDDTVLAARMARDLAESEGLPTVVVPTRAAVAGLAALAVHDPDREAAADAAAMADAADGCRTGMVLLATRDAATAAGPCRAGEALAYVERQAVAHGGDPDEIADELLRRLIRADSEVVTLVAGDALADAAGTSIAERLAARLRERSPRLEVTVVPGDPGRYVLLAGVE